MLGQIGGKTDFYDFLRNNSLSKNAFTLTLKSYVTKHSSQNTK